MLDEELQYETSIDTEFNWNTKEDEWEEGKGGWEDVEFSCVAYGGRPIPTFVWYIDDGDELDYNDNHFDISDSSLGSDYKYIENYMSTIKFGINHELIERLQKYVKSQSHLSLILNPDLYI